MVQTGAVGGVVYGAAVGGVVYGAAVGVWSMARWWLLISYQFIVFQLLWVNAVLKVDNVAIFLHDTHQLGPIPMQVTAGVQTHIPKPLEWKKCTSRWTCKRNSSAVNFQDSPQNMKNWVVLIIKGFSPEHEE